MKRVLLAFAVALVAAGSIHAQVPQACQRVMQTVCSGKTGQDAMNCLRSNYDRLPAKCKESLPKAPNPKS